MVGGPPAGRLRGFVDCGRWLRLCHSMASWGGARRSSPRITGCGRGRPWPSGSLGGRLAGVVLRVAMQDPAKPPQGPASLWSSGWCCRRLGGSPRGPPWAAPSRLSPPAAARSGGESAIAARNHSCCAEHVRRALSMCMRIVPESWSVARARSAAVPPESPCKRGLWPLPQVSCRFNLRLFPSAPPPACGDRRGPQTLTSACLEVRALCYQPGDAVYQLPCSRRGPRCG